MGPREHNNTNAPIPPDNRRNIAQSEMNNPAIEPVARKYAELRYQLLPYTYTLAWEARSSGLPLMRAMWLHYPGDPRARGLGTQFMWGRDLLVAPVFTKGATSREVYLPAGDWYDWWTNEKAKGGATVTRAVDLATMPLYVRAGAIVPFDPVRQYTSQPVTEPTTLKVYTGADGQYTLYADDGITQEVHRGPRFLDPDGMERPGTSALPRAGRAERGDEPGHDANVPRAPAAGGNDEGRQLRREGPHDPLLSVDGVST